MKVKKAHACYCFCCFILFFSQWIVGVKEKLDFGVLAETSEAHKGDPIITEIIRDITYKHDGESGK